MQAQTNKAAEKEEKREERKEKRAARLAKDSIMGEAAFNKAMQAITNQSFVLEATSVQPLNGRVYFVNSNTNFVSLNDGQAMVQIASNSPYPGPNGLGGITVQGTISNLQVKQDYVNNFEKYYKDKLVKIKFFYYSNNDNEETGVPLQPSAIAFRDYTDM